MPTGLGISLGVSRGEGARTYAGALLAADQFTTARAAGAVDNTAMEPGPGTRDVPLDSGGRLSLSGGRLQITGRQAADDPRFYHDTSFARATGRALFAGQRLDQLRVGWHASKANSPTLLAFQLAAAQLTVLGGGSGCVVGPAMTAGVDYEVGVILTSAGGRFVIRGGTQYPTWTQVLVMRSGTTSPLYAGAGVGGSSAASQLDDFRVRDLTGPWTDDYGISHARYAGAQAAGRTFIHPARTFIAWTQTTLPTVGTTIVEWRRQDANNLWRSTIDSAGNWLLIERAAGVDTTRITGSGVAAGHRCVIGHDGADLRLYSALTTALILTARGNYLTAAAHDGQTAGELTALGTGGAVSDLVIEPRDVAAYLAGV